MGLFNRRQQPTLVVPPAPPQVRVPQRPVQPKVSPPADSDWSDINAIRAEWPEHSLDPDADMRRWQEGIRLYDNDDYGSMMKSATLLSHALAHSLYSEGILRGDDLPETAFKVLFSAMSAPPDGRTFADSAQKAARLALTIVRENGWQPRALGGTQSDYFDPLIMDKGNYLLLTSALRREGAWAGALEKFFAVPPTRLTPEIPQSASDAAASADQVYAMTKRAEEGDVASNHYMDGLALWRAGHFDEALTKMAEAANLGSVQAMKDAGDLAREMGQHDVARFWYESGANAGHPGAMYNMGVLGYTSGDFDRANTWYQRAAEAGDVDGYAALTQLSLERGDPAAERRWAQLGAKAGQPFCCLRHGLHLVGDAPDDDVPMLRRGRDFLEHAGNAGEVSAMSLAASVNHDLGEEARAQQWVEKVVASGDRQEIDRLERWGLLDRT